ncbi:putative cation-transporting ATPase 13A3 [Atta colombica]|uniref:Putative cation-transporting ATPase 13A3 n=1 Tax=Atta colombica TaxID=520822 RepID=A0A195BFF9_9HYME|nr:putative cation-transporting ATPase 13A3 [Atta colombica]
MRVPPLKWSQPSGSQNKEELQYQNFGALPTTFSLRIPRLFRISNTYVRFDECVAPRAKRQGTFWYEIPFRPAKVNSREKERARMFLQISQLFLQEYTSERYRVITLVHKSLNHLPYAKMQCINRQAAEIDFLMLIIMERLPVLVELNIVCIKTVMVTGDNMLTALSVARDCDDHKISYASDLNESAESDGNTQIYFTKSDNQLLLNLLNSQPISAKYPI